MKIRKYGKIFRNTIHLSLNHETQNNYITIGSEYLNYIFLYLFSIFLTTLVSVKVSYFIHQKHYSTENFEFFFIISKKENCSISVAFHSYIKLVFLHPFQKTFLG